MPEKEFNLLDEPWLRVLDRNGQTEKLSLTSVFTRAHEFIALAGESPTQDVAVLRLLLGILHAVFTRVDENGQEAPTDTAEIARGRWAKLWDQGRFPAAVIKEYLEYFQERFYLFHPKRPFYQVAELDRGTDYRAAKLIGDLSESGNKIRLFQHRAGEAKRSLRYDEAARWLLHLNAFDDTSSKPTRTEGLKYPSPGAGWPGKLGLVYALGDNLFETLMFNFILLDDSHSVWAEEGRPAWELAEVRRGERVEIPPPKNQAELLTLQSRRLLLKREGATVVGYKLLGGDFFAKENAFVEQMTIWKYDERNLNYTPKRHDPAKQLWRDFAALTAKDHAARRPPGLINWLSYLEDEKLLPAKHIRLRAVAVKYGDKDFFVDDIGVDSISINAALLSELDAQWVTRIIDLLDVTNQCVSRLGRLASELAQASGDKDKNYGHSAKEEAYFRLDQPFRGWLAGLDPLKDDWDGKRAEWISQARQIVIDLGRELITGAGPKAFIGRLVEKGKSKELVTAPGSYLKFLGGLNKVLSA